MRTNTFAKWLGAALLSLATAAGAQTWTQLPGAANDIGVGPTGEAWVIGTDKPYPNDFGIYRLQGGNWVKVDGGAVRIDVGPTGPWVVNSSGAIYRWTGNGWAQVPGGAKDIGIGANGTVWVIGTNAEAGGFGIYRYNGNNGWDKIPGSAVRIDVDPAGRAWVVNNANDIFFYNGSAFVLVAGGGKAKDIGVGADGTVWVVGMDNVAWRWTGSTWTKGTGTLAEISVDHKGNPWGVNPGKQIFSSVAGSTPTPTPTPAPAPTPAPTGGSTLSQAAALGWGVVDAIGDLSKMMQKTKGPAMSKADAEKVFGWIARKVQSDRQSFCYKSTDPRGAGTIPTTCEAGKQNQAALCYNNCKAGYYGVGPVCWQSCPSGYTDTGAICHYSARSLTANLVRVGCHLDIPFVGCTIPKMDCPTGYINAGLFCAVKPPPKPAGMSGTDLDPMKDSYGRGAGTIPNVCPGGENDTGLCYRNCKAGYYGVGPVCWQRCGSGKTDCGAGCANSTTSCVTDTASMVVSSATFLGFLVSGGALGPATATVGRALSSVNTTLATGMAGLQAAQTTYMWLNDYVAYFPQATSEGVAKQIDSRFSKDAARWVKEQYGLVHLSMMERSNAEKTALRGLAAASGFDPTGVSAVVSAFAKPMCATDEPFPAVRDLY